jgi:hypothetical protein
VGQVDAHFGLFGDSAILCDKCTVSAERTTRSKIALDTPIEHLGDLGHVESHFGLFGES